MIHQLFNHLWQKIVDFLNKESNNNTIPICDFSRLAYEIRPCDVLLLEGRSRVGSVIKTLTQSSWTHAALYIGRIHDIEDPAFRQRLLAFYPARPDEQLVIEALLGFGTVVNPLSSYQHDHLRICRAQNFSPRDAQSVLSYSIGQLGKQYNIRQLLDLGRFLYPYAILPRRWQSSLFYYKPGSSTHNVCSTMIAEAFMSIKYPILPLIKISKNQQTQLYQRNPRLFCPRDFDDSPYFDIIKYPFYGDDVAQYRQIPWNPEGLLCDDQENCYSPHSKKETTIDKKKAQKKSSRSRQWTQAWRL
jgi:hypothetical protein